MSDWDHERYCAAAETEIARFAEVINDADLTVLAPSCPDWTLGDLVRHTGEVHRWVAAMVRDRTLRPYRDTDVDYGVPDDLDALAGWLARGAGPLLESLRGGPPETAVWSWGGAQNIGYWARRMLHETGVHRADGEIAVGRRPGFGTPEAVDGVEEYLENLPHAVRLAPGIATLRGEGETIGFTAADAGTGWVVSLVTDGFTWVRDPAVTGGAVTDAAVTASAADLLLFVYGRLAPGDTGIETSGDAALLDHWVVNSKH